MEMQTVLRSNRGGTGGQNEKGDGGKEKPGGGPKEAKEKKGGPGNSFTLYASGVIQSWILNLPYSQAHLFTSGEAKNTKLPRLRLRRQFEIQARWSYNGESYLSWSHAFIVSRTARSY